jgi:lysozyme family protein
MKYAEIWPRYAKFWDEMVINHDAVHEFDNFAHAAILHKPIYEQIEKLTGVPWVMTAVIHRRESDADFATYLGNGQSLARRTTEVPAGRGPFHGPSAFVDGAVDAYKVEGWASIKDWRLEKILFYCLLFNGTSHEPFHPSSYIWGLTNIQQSGKWVRDHVWNGSEMDTQPGCAPLLKTICTIEGIDLVRETA